MLSIALAQIEIVPGNPEKNLQTILSYIEKAKAAGADVVLFPALAVPGYFLGDTWEADAFLADCTAANEEIIAASRDIVIFFGSVAIDPRKRNNDGRIRKYNALFAAQNGKLLQPLHMPYPFHIKTLFPNYRAFDDARYFCSLSQLAEELGTTAEALLSPFTFTVRGTRYNVAGLLCEDGRSDDYAISQLSVMAKKAPLDFIVNLSSSPFTRGKDDKLHRVLGAQAKAHGTPLFYVNHIGIQNNGKTIYTFDGASAVYDKNGARRIEIAPYQEELVTVPLSSLAENVSCTASFEMHHPPQADEPPIVPIYRALAYGIRRFLAQIHMERVVIGISGGIDSAVAAALYTHVLGADRVLLINMPSRFNSETTKGLAHRLAHNLRSHYAVMPIQNAVDLTVKEMTETPIENLENGTATHFSLSTYLLENIQARDRSARILAAAAAAFGGGFTCNANKAETTVGYSTLYGDQSGCLAALADLWKHEIYDLARYLNDVVYKREVIPTEILTIVPSAELSDAQDVDAGKGDPLYYPYHDNLFRAFVERWQKTTPEDILAWYENGTLEAELGCAPGIVAARFATAADFIADLERWWNLFTGLAVAKRIQAPPTLAVSRRAFGFDHREAQNGVYYTRAYRARKARLLNAVHTK